MKLSAGNCSRALAEIVSVEAWHEPFTARKKHVNLHVDVVFATGRIGGEEESPVSFRLCIKRAELVIFIPEHEPLSIDRQSIERDPNPQTIKKISENRLHSSVKANATISSGLASLRPKVGAKVGKEKGSSSSDRISMQEKIASVRSTYRFSSFDSTNRWLLEPSLSENLQGRPWNPNKIPLLKLKD